MGVTVVLLPHKLRIKTQARKLVSEYLWPCFIFWMVAILTRMRMTSPQGVGLYFHDCVGCVFLCLLAVCKLSLINVYSDHLPIKRS